MAPFVCDHIFLMSQARGRRLVLYRPDHWNKLPDDASAATIVTK